MSLTESDWQYLRNLQAQTVFQCPRCHGSGVPCACQEQFAFEIKKAQAQIPIKYRAFTLEQITAPDSQKARDAVGRYVQLLSERRQAGDGLFLWSKTKGTAKTSYACVILLEALRRGYSAYFTDLDECVALTTGAWYDPAKERDLEQRILESDFLVIDDVGGREIKTMRNGEMIQTAFTTLFKARCDALLPTIMTSNLAPSDLTASYGERLYSVACEHLLIVECGGLDFRQEVIAKVKDL